MGVWQQLGGWLGGAPASIGLNLLDVLLVLLLTYVILVVIGERRTLWMVRGFIVLMLAAALSGRLQLTLLNFLLNNLVIGSAVAMAVLLQSEFRRFLELLGRGELGLLLRPDIRPQTRSDSAVDEIIEAVRELSQNRVGALIVVETGQPIDERDFSVPGVRLNSELSKELLQSLFQTSTLLHDGAVLVRDNRVIAAAVILPLSEQTIARRLGTRHRAALGITERVDQCLCIVVSEETGSISLAERGVLNRPLTSSKLRELLEDRLSHSVDKEVIAPDLRILGRKIGRRGQYWFGRIGHRLWPHPREKR